MICNHLAFPYRKVLSMSTDVTLSKSFIFQQLWKHPIIYMPSYISDPLKSKAWTYYWMVMFFLLGATLMNMMCNRALYSDSADPIVAVAVRSTVFLNFQIELPRVIQVQWIQVMDLPPQVPHVSSGVRLLDWLVVQQDVHSTVASGLTCAQL